MPKFFRRYFYELIIMLFRSLYPSYKIISLCGPYSIYNLSYILSFNQQKHKNINVKLLYFIF